MGLLGSLFGSEKELPPLDPASAVTGRLEKDREMLEAFARRVDDKLEVVPGDRGLYVFIGKPPNPIKVTVPIRGKPTELDITEEMKAACEGLVPPIAETMIDLIAAVDAEYQERVRNSIILAGGGSAIPGLSDTLQRALSSYGGGRLTVAQDPIYIGANGALALALDAHASDWEKLPA